MPPIRPEQRNQSSTPLISVSSRSNMGFIAAAVAAVALIVAGIWWFTTGGEQETSFQADPYIQSPPSPKSAENSPRQDPRQSPVQQSPTQSPAYNPRQSAPRD
jgi:hypothetical protein